MRKLYFNPQKKKQKKKTKTKTKNDKMIISLVWNIIFTDS